MYTVFGFYANSVAKKTQTEQASIELHICSLTILWSYYPPMNTEPTMKR